MHVSTVTLHTYLNISTYYYAYMYNYIVQNYNVFITTRVIYMLRTLLNINTIHTINTSLHTINEHILKNIFLIRKSMVYILSKNCNTHNNVAIPFHE